jgi:membrane-associated protease RseP (regulator of RpoE activity)
MNASERDEIVGRALPLFALTLLSMFWVGAQWAGVDVMSEGLRALWSGYPFALPLMAILLAHELGHYFAARIHRVDASPPYFIPMPFTLIGTFGAVIRMRESIGRRDALFDIGAAGPLSGLVIAIPVLIYGIAQSPIERLDPTASYLVEGRSLLYVALLAWLKGPIAEGYDVMLTPTALAGWAGLLVTMMNLVPVGQLDGGHVAYALFGWKQNVYSRRIRAALLAVAIAVGLISAVRTQLQGAPLDEVAAALVAGSHWFVWWIVLTLMARMSKGEHPPVEAGELSPTRRKLAWFTLLMFVLLFMPTWMETRGG